MSCSGIQSTVNLCTMREAQLTNELTDIMTNITQACRETSDLATITSSARESIEGDKTLTDDAKYKALDKVQDDYELNLAKISSWENELEIQKKQKETEIQATSSYKESFMSALKQNVQKDYKYGGSGSGS